MHVIARHLVIHGSVQGVGYRAAAVAAARGYGVIGWVRNRRDGNVEAFVQGTPGAVAAMVRWCHQGPRGAHVTRVDVADATPGTHVAFEWSATA